jgi:hypothetical protein
MRTNAGFLKYGVLSVFCLALVSMPYPAEAQVSIEERLQFLKDQSGCGANIAQFCEGIKAGSGRLYRCLDENKVNLTKSCIDVMPEAESLLKQAGRLGVIKR